MTPLIMRRCLRCMQLQSGSHPLARWGLLPSAWPCLRLLPAVRLRLAQKGCASALGCLILTIMACTWPLLLSRSVLLSDVQEDGCIKVLVVGALADGVLSGALLPGLNSRAPDGRRAQPCAGAGTSRCVQHRLGCGAVLDSLLMACQKQETGLEGSPALSGATGAGRAQGCCCRILRLLIAGWEGLIPSRAGLLHHMV